MNVLVAIPDTETRAEFFLPQLHERIESLGTVSWNDTENHYSESALHEQIPGVDVLVTGWGCPEVTKSVLANAEDLQLIAHTGGSVAKYVSTAVYEAGIAIISANGVIEDIERLERDESLEHEIPRNQWETMSR
ncbi:Rossmann-fold NAD(P)-binding domain-containing protein [Halocatena pleomorpha]|uniref:Uncharacterized protein n=1 Tax=Halocatena pleomorpha TaxID=1785090 RepID=A0A3P3R9T1_9EURY|nr:hypothetical protein [Halocatena pleomorpha]RRJ29440.1 hypothetical protein EIK79_12415 [Halocatena pleomorpha]